MKRRFDREYLWHIPRQMDSDGNRALTTFYDHLPVMGSPDYDHEAFIRTPMSRELIRLLEPFLIFDDEDGRPVKMYWEARGLRKTVHDGDSHAPDWNKYCVFTPLEAQANPAKKYPCIIYIHGSRLGGTRIFCEESSGVAAMAAKYGLICALPDNNTEAGMLRLYEKLIRDYPVDASRVYLSGFSSGADCSVGCGLKHPELFAGILSLCGNPASKLFDEAAALRARQFGMPFIGIGGMCEMVTRFPLCEFAIKRPDEVARHQNNPTARPEGKIQGLNAYLAANGLETASLEEVRAFVAQSRRPAIKAIGVKTPYCQTQTLLGLKHYSAEFRNIDGAPLVKFVAVENHPHHPVPTAYDIAWGFLKGFSRDVSTGKLGMDVVSSASQ